MQRQFWNGSRKERAWKGSCGEEDLQKGTEGHSIFLEITPRRRSKDFLFNVRCKVTVMKVSQALAEDEGRESDAG